MQLYFSPGACSLATHITLREAGLPFELKRADTKTKKLEDGSDFFAINSKGAVPALRLDNGQVLTEGVAIMQYLADQKPESNLAPRNGTIERYRLQEWLNYMTSEVHKCFSPLWNPDRGAAGARIHARQSREEVRLAEQAARRQEVPDGRHFHDRGCLSVRGRELDQFPGHRPRQVAGHQGVLRTRRRPSEGAGSDGRRRTAQEGRLKIRG